MSLSVLQVILTAAGAVLAYVLVPLGAASMNIPNWLNDASDATAFLVFMAILFGSATAMFFGFMFYARKWMGIEI